MKCLNRSLIQFDQIKIKKNIYNNRGILSMTQVYSIKTGGISCTNCAAKIKKAILEELGSQVEKVSVNILQETVNIAIKYEETLQRVLLILQKIGYPACGEPALIMGQKNVRSVTFVYCIGSGTEQIEETVRNLPGIISINRIHSGDKIKLTVNYNSQIIKGREIGDVIEEKDSDYKVVNHRVQMFKRKNEDSKKGPNIKITGLLCVFFLTFNMILPLTGDWFMEILTFPDSLGVFTISVLINFCLTIYVLNIYAKPFIFRSYRSYIDSRDMNMETLISLGCVSAFVLFLFFVGRYTFDFINDELNNKGQAIMNINDALTSSSIIVLVVTIGKYFEGKVKRKIQDITQHIFPESTLFVDMTANFVELKNRKLMVHHRKNYDVTLIEEGDIIEPKDGRLLVDGIVLQGEIQAIQSAVNGNDEVAKFQKGERIQSGSIIQGKTADAFIQVENVFEKSILIEIGTHIRLRENEQSHVSSGIQEICKTISKYFVKSVIFLSLFVMVVWLFLLSFNFVEVEGCNICWIVERGIGILVASCPCALGLAVPSVIAIVLNVAIRNGILIRSSSVLEKMKKSSIVAFDKTGTLFTRINQVEQHYNFSNQIEENRLWQIIAIVQKQIKHPLAEILYKQGFNRSNVNGTNFNYLMLERPKIQKNGLTSKIIQKKTDKQFNVLIGNEKLLFQNNVHIPEYVRLTNASTLLFLALNDKCYLGMAINTHSNLRPEALDVVQQLMRLGQEVHILSGDSRESVSRLGDELKVPGENLHPEHSAFMKENWIKQTQQGMNEDEGKGKGVIMVGDGLNDIPCLQEAAIGISINAKSQLNLQAADIIMLSEDLCKMVSLIKLLKRGNQFININLFWAFLYNLTIMPIVAGAFYGLDITISPIWSSVAMSCSSIIVVAFSNLLSLFNYNYISPNQQQKKKSSEMIELIAENSEKGIVKKRSKYEKFAEEETHP